MENKVEFDEIGQMSLDLVIAAKKVPDYLVKVLMSSNLFGESKKESTEVNKSDEDKSPKCTCTPTITVLFLPFGKNLIKTPSAIYDIYAIFYMCVRRFTMREILHHINTKNIYHIFRVKSILCDIYINHFSKNYKPVGGKFIKVHIYGCLMTARDYDVGIIKSYTRSYILLAIDNYGRIAVEIIASMNERDVKQALGTMTLPQSRLIYASENLHKISECELDLKQIIEATQPFKFSNDHRTNPFIDKYIFTHMKFNQYYSKLYRDQFIHHVIFESFINKFKKKAWAQTVEEYRMLFT